MIDQQMRMLEFNSILIFTSNGTSILLLHSLEVLAKYDTHQSEVNTFPKILLGNLPLTQSDITAIEFGSL